MFLADGEPIVLGLAKTILKRNGYRVISAENGRKAREIRDAITCVNDLHRICRSPPCDVNSPTDSVATRGV